MITREQVDILNEFQIKIFIHPLYEKQIAKKINYLNDTTLELVFDYNHIVTLVGVQLFDRSQPTLITIGGFLNGYRAELYIYLLVPLTIPKLIMHKLIGN